MLSAACCVRLLPRSLPSWQALASRRGAPFVCSLVGCGWWCGVSVNASDLWVKSRGWFDPWISRSLLGASYQRASDGKCVEAEAPLSASEKVPALGSLVGRMLLAYAANSAVRVRCFQPLRWHLSTRTSRGARLCPLAIGWVGHILWLAKAKPPAGWGSYHIFLNRAGPARGPPSRVGGVCGRHSVNLSLAACASRALRFESKNNS